MMPIFLLGGEQEKCVVAQTSSTQGHGLHIFNGTASLIPFPLCQQLRNNKTLFCMICSRLSFNDLTSSFFMQSLLALFDLTGFFHANMDASNAQFKVLSPLLESKITVPLKRLSEERHKGHSSQSIQEQTRKRNHRKDHSQLMLCTSQGMSRGYGFGTLGQTVLRW